MAASSAGLTGGAAPDQREWLEADDLGGFAMGTVSGIRTRRYHALLTVAPILRPAAWCSSARSRPGSKPATALSS